MAKSEKSQIGLVSCVAFAVGTMVGAGVFVLSGLAVERAGPAALVSFVVAGVLVLLSGLSFAVVASLATPGASGYSYVGTALGRYWGFVTSWAFYIGGIIATAFVLNAFGAYMHQFFWSGLPVTAIALLAAALLTLVNLGPASAIGRIETVLVVVKVAILVLLIVFAFIHVRPAYFRPFAPQGFTPVLTTSGLLFVAYLGFNVVTNIAGDVRDARRTVPLAILISMLVVALVYAGVVVALLAGGISTYDEASVGVAARNLMGVWGGVLIPIGALISTLSSANANILGSSEIMVRLAAEKEVPTLAGWMWRGHPLVSVLLGAVLYAVLILSGGTQAIVSLANVAAIAAMVLVNAAAIRALRSPSYDGLKLPLGPVLPALGLVAVLVQLFFIGWVQVLIGLVLVFSGSVVYFLKTRLHDPAQHRAIVVRLGQNDGPASRALGRRRSPM
jgi:basic amino acid/polyamine antiporter, APA family